MAKRAKTATFMQNLPGFSGLAHLYRCDPPMVTDGARGRARYIIVSATTIPGGGAETLIFPATVGGIVTSWGELPGSLAGTLDHDDAIRAAGYEPR